MFTTAARRWGHRVLVAVFGLSVALSVEPAVFGVQHLNPGAFGGVIGAAIGSRLRRGDLRRLARPERRRVERAVVTGIPTGAPSLDRTARELLLEAARSRSRANAVGAGVLAVLCVAIVVAATLRTGDAWYLLVLVPAVAVAAEQVGVRATRDHPLERLARFDALVAERSPAVPSD